MLRVENARVTSREHRQHVVTFFYLLLELSADDRNFNWQAGSGVMRCLRQTQGFESTTEAPFLHPHRLCNAVA